MASWIARWVPTWLAKRLGLTVAVAVLAVATVGCAQQSSTAAATVDDKTYVVTPASVTVEAGIITGEVTRMKVTERVERGSDRVVSPAQLTGILKLKNTSADHTVRLVVGKILYLDPQGRPIQLEEARTEPALRFSTYNTERLDPGQETTQSVDVAFPAAALKAKNLKEIRVALAYIASPYLEETMAFTVAVSEGR